MLSIADVIVIFNIERQKKDMYAQTLFLKLLSISLKKIQASNKEKRKKDINART